MNKRITLVEFYNSDDDVRGFVGGREIEFVRAGWEGTVYDGRWAVAFRDDPCADWHWMDQYGLVDIEIPERRPCQPSEETTARPKIKAVKPLWIVKSGTGPFCWTSLEVIGEGYGFGAWDHNDPTYGRNVIAYRLTELIEDWERDHARLYTLAERVA